MLLCCCVVSLETGITEWNERDGERADFLINGIKFQTPFFVE
jgi:hypothetical protein